MKTSEPHLAWNTVYSGPLENTHSVYILAHSTCKNFFFHTCDYLHSADSPKKIFEIPPFFNSQFSGRNTRKLRVFFLHTNAALEVKNRVQFAWAK